jgi:hypothetical protein
MDQQLEHLDGVINSDVAGFNALLREAQVSAVVPLAVGGRLRSLPALAIVPALPGARAQSLPRPCPAEEPDHADPVELTGSTTIQSSTGSQRSLIGKAKPGRSGEVR